MPAGGLSPMVMSTPTAAVVLSVSSRALRRILLVSRRVNVAGAATSTCIARARPAWPLQDGGVDGKGPRCCGRLAVGSIDLARRGVVNASVTYSAFELDRNHTALLDIVFPRQTPPWHRLTGPRGPPGRNDHARVDRPLGAGVVRISAASTHREPEDGEQACRRSPTSGITPLSDGLVAEGRHEFMDVPPRFDEVLDVIPPRVDVRHHLGDHPIRSPTTARRESGLVGRVVHLQWPLGVDELCAFSRRQGSQHPPVETTITAPWVGSLTAALHLHGVSIGRHGSRSAAARGGTSYISATVMNCLGPCLLAPPAAGSLNTHPIRSHPTAWQEPSIGERVVHLQRGFNRLTARIPILPFGGNDKLPCVRLPSPAAVARLFTQSVTVHGYCFICAAGQRSEGKTH